MTSGIVRRIAAGTAIAAATLAATSALALPASASDDPAQGAVGFGQVAAAPVDNRGGHINQIVGTVGAPLVNVNLSCTAAWQQGGLLGSKYNACNTAPTYQLEGTPVEDSSPSATGFGQVAAAPVDNKGGSVNQVVGTVGAPLVNVNLPCTAPWQQGGLLGSKYNACNTAPTHQETGPQATDSQDDSDAPATGFGQVAAAPVDNKGGTINQIVGTAGAPLVNANLTCTAPWNQGGVAGAKYNACNTAPTYQQDGAQSTNDDSADSPSSAGFGQVAAAPVDNKGGTINQVVGTVGAPLVNVNLPCTAPWQQGGLLGSKYNACNTAPTHQ